MSEALLNWRCLIQVLGQARFQRLIRAGWLAPVQRSHRRVLFSVRDVHAALRRLEREPCPPNKAEVLRVRLSELRNGHPRIRKEKAASDLVLDFSAFKISNGVNL